MSLADLLAGAPDPAVYAGSRSVSCDEIAARAAAIASALGAAGVEPGMVAAVSLPNGPEVVATLFGVWRAGAVYAPVNPRSPAVERAGNVDALGAAVTITEAGIERTAAEPARYDAGVALVQFTSGTTGPPKPVPLRHDTVLDLLDRVVETLRGGRPRDGQRAPMPNLVPVSLSLWAGIYQVLFAFRVGAPVVVMEQFGTAEFAALVRQFGIRSTVLPPAAMAMLAGDEAVTDLAPLRMVRSITAPLAPAQARRFRERFGVLVMNSYGQTELGGEVIGWSAADAREHGEAKLGSVGRPHAGVEVKVVDDEIAVRTPATGGEWVHTGDLGRVDDDGFVWIEGRVTDMINRGGLKVFPAHVEDVLLDAPGVRDAAVVGEPDDRLGEVPVAYVVGDPVEAELLQWCRARLAPYKVPARIVYVDALPRNEIGKILKRALTDRAAGLRRGL